MYLDPTPENVDKARAFVARKWRQWCAEYGKPAPADLSGSCRFSSQFARRLFGGRIVGNEHHVFVRLADGTVLDLNAGAADVRACADPYRHDPWVWRYRPHLDLQRSCRPRVARWVREFLDEPPAG